MESYPTSLAHDHDQHSKHLANHAPAEPGQTTPSHGGLVQGHEFDMPITPSSPATFPKVPESSNHFEAAAMETAPSKNEVPTLETVPQTPSAPGTPTMSPAPRPQSEHLPPRPVSMPPQPSNAPSMAPVDDGTASTAATGSQSRKPTGKIVGVYSMTKTLGAGSMGKVKLAEHTITGEKVHYQHIFGYHSPVGLLDFMLARYQNCPPGAPPITVEAF